MFGNVDFLTEKKASVKVAEMNRDTSKRFDQVLLNRGQPILASKIFSDSVRHPVEPLAALVRPSRFSRVSNRASSRTWP